MITIIINHINNSAFPHRRQEGRPGRAAYEDPLNHVNQKVAQAMLRKMGLRADVVADGQEAVNALKSISYDLVLMDCQMPEMDGFEATRLIRQHESKVLNPRIPIIAMTAATMQGDREKCIQAGMSDFIAKPVQKRELAEMLARWLTTTVGYNPNTKAI
jgi:two-component system sensor histidine kinase/response regulator